MFAIRRLARPCAALAPLVIGLMLLPAAWAGVDSRPAAKLDAAALGTAPDVELVGEEPGPFAAYAGWWHGSLVGDYFTLLVTDSGRVEQIARGGAHPASFADAQLDTRGYFETRAVVAGGGGLYPLEGALETSGRGRGSAGPVRWVASRDATG